MMIFSTMDAACEHFARQGFTHGQTSADGRVLLLHSAKPVRVYLAYTTAGRVRSLRVLGRTSRLEQQPVPTAGAVLEAAGSRWGPLGQLIAVPFIAAFAAFGLVLALGLIGWGRLPGGWRRS